jgi:hypothetical protein
MSIRKKEKRKIRHINNIRKEETHKKEAWDNGKLIEENHNQGPYSPEYTKDLCKRLIDYLWQEKQRSLTLPNPANNFVVGFRKYKMKIQDLILHWNPEVEKNYMYKYLKRLLEIYWDQVLFGNEKELIEQDYDRRQYNN